MLRNSNKEVVIKVVKPGVEEVLQTDLDFLHVASKVVEFLNPELSRISLVSQCQIQQKTLHIRTTFLFFLCAPAQWSGNYPCIFYQSSSHCIILVQPAVGT